MQLLIDLRQRVLPKERHAESRKELLHYCCNQASTKHGVTAFCETFKTSYRTGQHLMNGDSANQAPVIPFGSTIENHRISSRDVKNPPVWQETFFLEYSSDSHCTRGESGKQTFWSQILRS